jgi:DNA-directed RNA polymerase specialized sigma24 family protein
MMGEITTTGAGFDALVDAERDGLVRLAFVLSGSAAIAEEVVQ